MPAVSASCFALNVVQSAESRKPSVEPFACGMLMLGFAPPLEAIGAVAVTELTAPPPPPPTATSGSAGVPLPVIVTPSTATDVRQGSHGSKSGNGMSPVAQVS